MEESVPVKIYREQMGHVLTEHAQTSSLYVDWQHLVQFDVGVSLKISEDYYRSPFSLVADVLLI